MDNRFANLFGLSEKKAIELLDTPVEQLGEDDSRYIAADQLANYPTEQSIAALMRAAQNTHDSLDNRITRRKSIESLGKLKAAKAMAVICDGLGSEDRYTTEVAAWAIGEIGTQDLTILEEVAQVLERPDQTHRVAIHTLAKLGYMPALERIKPFLAAEDGPTMSAAVSAIAQLTKDYSEIDKIVALLQSDDVNTRRACVQDLIDARYYGALDAIASCPISVTFRLRAIRLLGKAALEGGSLTFSEIQPSLEKALLDHPETIKLVHEYDQPPVLDFVVRELYQTDAGRCYLAIKTILETYTEQAPAALFQTYKDEAHNDYGAHYYVMKLMGWLKHAAAYELLVEALHDKAPQFQKSRAAAAMALGELGNPKAIPELKTSLETSIWDLKYAALIALENLGDRTAHSQLANDADWAVSARAAL